MVEDGVNCGMEFKGGEVRIWYEVKEEINYAIYYTVLFIIDYPLKIY